MNISNNCGRITVTCLWLLATTATTSAFSDQNDQASGSAANAATPAATSATIPAAVNLSKVQVKGVRELVHSLQEVKIALKRPFDNDPKHVDYMVCELQTEMHYYGLECGTEGWFSMRRETYQVGLMSTGNGFAGGSIGQAAVPTRGHPWHSFHALNHTQMMYLRRLLKILPAPDSEQKILVEWNQRQSTERPQPKPAESTHPLWLH